MRSLLAEEGLVDFVEGVELAAEREERLDSLARLSDELGVEGAWADAEEGDASLPALPPGPIAATSVASRTKIGINELELRSVERSLRI